MYAMKFIVYIMGVSLTIVKQVIPKGALKGVANGLKCPSK